MRTITSRVAALFRRRRLDRELDEEVAFHLSMLEQECIAAGMSPAQARRAARREFGGVAQTKETYRDGRGVLWVEDTVRDLRHALRRLKSKPGFTSTAVLSLALGIGSATAVFSLFQPLMMRKLPVPRPHELAVFEVTGGISALAQTRFYSVPYPLYKEVAARSDLFLGVAATTGTGRMLSDPETYGELVSGNYFSVLGVAPALGRLFLESDNREGNKVAVISYDLWHRRFGGAPGALGQRIDGYEIIGVARQGFNGVDADRRSEMWLPAAKYGQLDEPATSWIRMIGRRAPDITDEQRQAALDVLAARYFDRVSTPFDAVSRRITMERRLKLREGSLGFSSVRDQFGNPLIILMGAVAVLLLAACVNVAALIFARALAERRERALRIALGAGRVRIARQSMIESAVLGLSGGFVGLLFAAAGRRCVLHFLPASFGKPFDSAYVAAFLFSLGLLVVSTVAFGLIPAFRASNLDPASGLVQARGSESGAKGSLRKWLMIAQVAFSAVLVGLAALFGASLAELRSSGARFPNRNVLAFSARFAAGPSVKADFTARIEALPGVSSVSAGSAPFTSGLSTSSVFVQGSERTIGHAAQVLLERASDRYFETLGHSMVAGREFNQFDTANGGERVIVNEAFVRALMPGETNPTRRSLSFDAAAPALRNPVPIIGVVRDIPHHGLRVKVEPTVYLALPHASGPQILVASSVPSSTIIPAIRREAEKLNGTISVEPQTIARQIDDSIFQDRILAALSALFGAMALLLAAVGLYGIVAFETARRSREIGIRIALGAGRATVVWMVLRDALVLIAAGLVIGIPAAILAARAARSIVFGINPGDPRIFVSAALALIAAGLAAAFLPARRAVRMDPMQALRHE